NNLAIPFIDLSKPASQVRLRDSEIDLSKDRVQPFLAVPQRPLPSPFFGDVAKDRKVPARQEVGLCRIVGLSDRAVSRTQRDAPALKAVPQKRGPRGSKMV